jgi:hypothetical protein
MRSLTPVVFLATLVACADAAAPSGPSAIVGASLVSAGNKGSCAVGGSGGLACWGALPDGIAEDTTSGAPDVLGAVEVTTPTDLLAIGLSKVGENSGCAVGSDHQAYCWGMLVAFGDQGHDLGPGIHALAGASSASSVAMSISNICVTRTDRQVRCYGAFAGGARGTDSVDLSDAGPGFSLTSSGLSPTLAAFGATLGTQMGCALRTDSLVACWGIRNRGQLGGTVADTVEDCSSYAPSWCQPGPALVAGGHKYRQISTAFDYVCATRIAGGVDCWGRRPEAPLTDGTCTTAADCVNTPTPVTLPAPAVRVTVGWKHACALLNTGEVYCWGDNTYGQLGQTGLGASTTPVKVDGGYTFVTISAGSEHTCGIEAGSGAIGCWGRNDAGQLGDGTTTDRSSPVAVIAAE